MYLGFFVTIGSWGFYAAITKPKTGFATRQQVKDGRPLRRAFLLKDFCQKSLIAPEEARCKGLKSDKNVMGTCKQGGSYY